MLYSPLWKSICPPMTFQLERGISAPANPFTTDIGVLWRSDVQLFMFLTCSQLIVMTYECSHGECKMTPYSLSIALIALIADAKWSVQSGLNICTNK